MSILTNVLAAGAFAAALMGSAATAATVTTVGGANDVDAGLSVTVTGGAFSGLMPDIETGSQSGQYRSPFEGTSAFATTPYFNVLGGQSRVVALDVVSNTLEFLWGSPDSYNYVDLQLGNTNVASLSLADIPGPLTVGLGAVKVNIFESSGFDLVVFTSNNNSFEFSNISVAAVPLPAAGLMLIIALGGLAATRRRSA